MTPTQAELYRQLREFPMDDGVPCLSFTDRLARENGWSRSYAERVIAEYRRFLFLTATVGEPVCPSEEVDAAWHQHLTFTRSYWRLCGEVLDRLLHHDPTQGGPAEADKHLRMDDRTLAAYAEAFGEAPPVDIWPPAQKRFGEDLHHRVVNTARNWVIPKAIARRTLAVALLAVVGLVCATGCGIRGDSLSGNLVIYFLAAFGAFLLWVRTFSNPNKGNKASGCGGGCGTGDSCGGGDCGGGCGGGCGAGCGGGCGGGCSGG